MSNSVDDFLRHASLKRGSVKIRGQVVHIRELTVGARADFLKALEADRSRATLVLVRAGVTDADGVPLFGRDEDAERLNEAAPSVTDEISRAVLRLSGLGDDDTAAEVDGAEKKP
jgi:hypothetical protein